MYERVRRKRCLLYSIVKASFWFSHIFQIYNTMLKKFSQTRLRQKENKIH